MKKTLTAVAAALIITVATVAAPQQADARSRHGHGHRGHGGNVAGALIGGLAFGALLGAAASNGGYYYGPRCYWTTERYWNGWRWRHQRVRVCD